MRKIERKGMRKIERKVSKLGQMVLRKRVGKWLLCEGNKGWKKKEILIIIIAH